MRLDHRFIRLPLRLDAQRLAAEIAALPEDDWHPHPQGYPGNSALALVAVNGDPKDDGVRGPMLATPNLARLPYVRQIMASFDAPIGRSRLMRLDGNAEATAHVDTNYYWMGRVRIHIPVVTLPDVHFLCGKSRVHMRAGECWIFDTFSLHNVLNPLPTRRIHLVIDSVGSPRFWELVARGFHPAADELHPAPDEIASVLAFDTHADAQPPTERVHLPLVMAPFEVQHWIDFVFGELRAACLPQTTASLQSRLNAMAMAFLERWRDAWARWGDDAQAWKTYASLLEGFNRELEPLEKQLRLRNQVDAVELLRQCIVRAAFNPPRGEPRSASTPIAATEPAPQRGRLDRPIFIVSPPRSGSSLLFETLARAPQLWTIGGESHALIEQIPPLHPAARDFASNRLTASDATPMTVAELSHGFFNQLRDRDGHHPRADATALRFLEKTPKNSLRVAFFAAAYPDARFVFLHREPRDVLSSMLDAWRSGRFVTYPNLPDWRGAERWSLALAPGWRQWSGMPLADVVARQWASIVDTLLEDLAALDPDHVAVSSYAQLLSNPQAEIERLCVFADLDWDQKLDESLPLSRHTLSAPDPDKWKRNAAEVEAMLALLKPTLRRLDSFVQARALSATSPRTRPSPPPVTVAPIPTREPSTPAPLDDPTAAFRSVFTQDLPAVLQAAGSALAVTTYQSGRLILLRLASGQVNTHFKAFPSPMGLAVGNDRIALATARQIWDYRNNPAVAAKLEPIGVHDACYLPRGSHVTGDIRVHEIGFAQDQLWIVNTRFSCLCTLDPDHSFVPRWRPAFVSALDASDRCHLNGMCIVDDRVRFVTALGETDAPGGWRENKGRGGLLIDVASGEFVARGLSMPHSPRWYQGRIWLLESGKGSLATVDLANGKVDTVVELPGFTRGLAFAGHYAFVGLSQVRESVFGGLPLTERLSERLCGVWAVDLRSGRVAGFLRFEGAVQEVFDLQFLHGVRFPELFEPEEPAGAGAFVLP